jgi:hypothetical protein
MALLSMGRKVKLVRGHGKKTSKGDAMVIRNGRFKLKIESNPDSKSLK